MLCSRYVLLEEYNRSWQNKSVYLFIYLFAIYFLFSDTICSSNYIVSNVGMFIKHWIGEDMEGSGFGLIQGIL